MFYNLEKIESFHPLFQAVENCKGIKQKEEYHPEGDVFVHSIQTLHYALKESRNIDLIIAAMLHDVGKQVGDHGHEEYGVKLLENYISEDTKWLILNHMRIWYLLTGEMKKLNKIYELYTNPLFSKLILLARWDKMARRKNWVPRYDRGEIVEKLKGYKNEYR